MTEAIDAPQKQNAPPRLHARVVHIIETKTILLGVFVRKLAFATFLHGLELLFPALGTLGSALHQFRTHQFEDGLFGAVAFAPAEPNDAGVTAVALTEPRAQLIEQLLDRRRVSRETAAACRRACSVSCLASVIIFSTSGLAAFALGTVVTMRSCSITLVTRFRSSALREPPSRLSLYPDFDVSFYSLRARLLPRLFVMSSPLISGEQRGGWAGVDQCGPARRTSCRTRGRGLVGFP